MKQFRLGIFLLQVLQIILFLTVMLNTTSFGPTLDDSWIHYQFARNIAEHGEVSFNTGEWSIGTTSLLWDLILAIGIKMGVPVVFFSVFLGIVFYFILAQLVITIFRSYWTEGLNPYIAALIVILSGNLLWYALSGMETMLMLALALLWVIFFSQKRYILSGIITGLLILTRIEGLMFLVLGLLFVVRNHGFKGSLKPALQLVLFTIPFMLPTIILNLAVAGEIYPTTMAGKKWLYDMGGSFINTSPKRALRFIISWIFTLVQNSWMPEFMDRPITVFNSFLAILVNKRIPQPVINPYPIWTQLSFYFVGLFFLFMALAGMIDVVKRRWGNLKSRSPLSRIEYLLVYFLSLNLLYLMVLPTKGHGGRYQAVNFIIAGLFLVAGITQTAFLKKLWGEKGKKIILTVLFVIYGVSCITWSKIYANTVKHVNEVHVAAGKWMKENLPPETIIGVFDVGAIKYISELPVVDIAGLTDREALNYVLEGNITGILEKRKAEYLVMVEDYTLIKSAGPEKLFSNSSYYERLGIVQEIGKSMNLVPVKKFALPLDIWWWNNALLKTHGPVIAIYKIEWIDQE